MTPPVPTPFHGRGVFDTEEVKAVVRRLTDALYDYLTLDVVGLERAATMPMPEAPSYPPPNPEKLIEAQEQLELMRNRLEEGKTALETQDQDLPEGLAVMFRVGVLGVLEDQIRAQESYLSRLQAAMEKASA